MPEADEGTNDSKKRVNALFHEETNAELFVLYAFERDAVF